MHITGQTRVFMILGDPIAQVRAPELFNPLFRRHGVDAVLVPAHVSAADTVAFARTVLGARNIDGLWLTIPHKAALLPVLDRCDRLGTVAQAVNAVRRNADGSLEGALFDGLGFLRSLEQAGGQARGQRALVVGAGGAGVAISVSLAEAGATALSLYDPDQARAQAVAARIRAAFPTVDAQAVTHADPAGFDLVVNASPLGLKAGDALPVDPARVEPAAMVVDILMKNQPTPLLQACAARGARTLPGFEMLVQQAGDYLDFFGLHDLARTVMADPSDLRAALAAR